MSRKRKKRGRMSLEAFAALAANLPLSGPTCEVCGGAPIIPELRLCGPCATGDASTAGETFTVRKESHETPRAPGGTK